MCVVGVVALTWHRRIAIYGIYCSGGLELLALILAHVSSHFSHTLFLSFCLMFRSFRLVVSSATVNVELCFTSNGDICASRLRPQCLALHEAYSRNAHSNGRSQRATHSHITSAQSSMNSSMSLECIVSRSTAPQASRLRHPLPSRHIPQTS